MQTGERFADRERHQVLTGLRPAAQRRHAVLDLDRQFGGFLETAAVGGAEHANRDHIYFVATSPDGRDLLFGQLHVAGVDGDLIEADAAAGRILQLQCGIQDALGVVVVARLEVGLPKVDPRERLVGCHLGGELELADRFGAIALLFVQQRRVGQSGVIVRIGGEPHAIDVERFLHIRLDGRVIACFDVVTLDLTDLLAQLVGPGCHLAGLLRLRQVAVDRAEPRVGERELRIEIDRAAEERHRIEIAVGPSRAQPLAVGFQRLERACRGLFDLSVVALDRAERFAQLLPEPRHRIAHHRQHRLLVLRLGLLLGQHAAAHAVLRVERDHVRRPEHRDGAAEQRLGAGALAYFSAHFSSDRRHRLERHQPQCGLHLLVGHDIQERRLPQLQRQRFTQRVVEHRVAGAVDHRRQHHRVFLRQGGRRDLVVEQEAGDQSRGQQRRTDQDPPSPA